MFGIFILKGMALEASEFTLSVGEDGKISSRLSLSLGYDACTAWAHIAQTHRKEALNCMDRRRTVWSDTAADENIRGTSLEEEFFASAQAITAAAICFDAFYDHLNRCAPVPQSIHEAWLKKKTARYIQISETIRAAFKITAADAKQLKSTLKAIFMLRDRVVHPSSAALAPQPHPEIGVSTEWRFSVYRGDVADTIVCQVIGLLWDLSRFTKFKSEKISRFMEGFKSRLDGLLPDGRPVPLNATVNYFLPDYPSRAKS